MARLTHAVIRKILPAPQIPLGALLPALFLAASPVHAVEPPHPLFPIGSLTARLQVITTPPRPQLAWSIQLPDNETAADYTFFIRQKQVPALYQADAAVSQSGEMMSLFPQDGAGSIFELWAVHKFPVFNYLLDSTFYSPFFPKATVAIRSEDPYPILPRTRADRPFYVDYTISDILGGSTDPASSKGVTLFRHTQSYGTNGTGANIDRFQATLHSQTAINANGSATLTYALSSIAGPNPAKLRGEERFSIFSLPDYQNPADPIPPYQLSSKFIQIWPVADGTISGITAGQTLGAQVPAVTLTLHDLYPDSTTFAQVYKGSPRPAVTGTVISGSSVTINSAIPQDRTLTVSNYGSVFDSDGLWTLEVATRTPFGTDRITSVSFNIQGKGLTIDGWRQLHFGNPDNTGDGANPNDFDHDGLTNLIEFAFGLDPKNPSSSQLPTPQLEGNQRVIRFTQPAGLNGVSYGAEWSPSLAPGSWTRMADTGTGTQHVFVVPGNAGANVFLRLTAGGM